MAETQNNIPILHRKEWQTMMQAPTATAAGASVISDPSGNTIHSLYVASNTVHYLYHHDEDDWQPITSGAFAVAIAAGFCGTFHPWSVPYTANGGSTTTVTVAAASFNLNGNVRGKRIEFLTGTAGNVGIRRTISEITTNAGIGTITLTLDYAVPSVVANTDTFRVSSGSFFMLNAGTLAATNYFKRFDLGTYAWSDRAITGLPATWGTDGKMVTPSMVETIFDKGIASSGSATQLNDTTKAWTTNQWATNYQLRITGGTGLGQALTIISNTNTQITTAAGATIDNTSLYVIESLSYEKGLATGGSATTLIHSGKTWTTDQWKNYQVRITGGTGRGQIRTITANNGTTLTIAAGATIDATSYYVIEGEDDTIYILGNNAVTLYKNSISGNTTTTVTPSAVRAGAPIAGMSADFVGQTGVTGWDNVSDIKDGRYIYCLRGGTAVIDRYDIPTQAWLPTTGVNYPSIVTFATGDSTFWNGRYIYIAKEGTAAIPQRIYKYALRGNYIEPVSTDWYLGGVALLGNKIWIKNLSGLGTVKWLYCLQSTSVNLRRIMLF